MRPLAAIVSGLLFASAFPPFDLTLLAWVAMVPVLLALREASVIKAAGLCALFTLSAVLALVSWVPSVLLDGFRATWLGAGGIWLALALSSVPAALIYGAVVSRLPTNTVLYPLTVGLLWACVELSWANAFPRLPWVVLGASQIDAPVAPLAALVGVHGVSGLVAATSAAIAQLVLADSRRYAAAASALLGVLAVGGTATAGRYLEAPATEGESLRVAIVQPGLPMSRRSEIGFERENIRVLIEESEAALATGDVDLLVWPESSFLSTPHYRSRLTNRVQTLVDEHSVQLLAGGRRREGGSWRTSIFSFSPHTGFEVAYDKQLLLPFAEHVPPWISPSIRRALGQLAPSRSHRSGAKSPEFAVGSNILSLAICYEATFQRSAPSSELIVNVVNDGWYDQTAGAAQHLLLSRWRAVEGGVPILRAAATGTSAFFGANGVARSSIGSGERSHLVSSVVLAPASAPFPAIGNATVISAALASLCLFAPGTRRRRDAAKPVADRLTLLTPKPARPPVDRLEPQCRVSL